MQAGAIISLGQMTDSELLRAARVKAMDFNGELIVRLRGLTPLMSAIAVIAVSAILCAFLYAFWGIFTGRAQAPQLVVIIAVVITMGLAIHFAWSRHSAISSGRENLVIDETRRIVRLPHTFGRKFDVELAFDQIIAIDVAYGNASEEYSMDDLSRLRRMNVDHAGSPRDVGHRSEMYYFPVIVWQERGGTERVSKIAKWTELPRARALAAWIDRRLR